MYSWLFTDNVHLYSENCQRMYTLPALLTTDAAAGRHWAFNVSGGLSLHENGVRRLVNRGGATVPQKPL